MPLLVSEQRRFVSGTQRVTECAAMLVVEGLNPATQYVPKF